ncbi:hypothetical protein D9758_000736 [Tetrapyrgos nigripes]|uniref:Uncharacterized protein n=1 Tax=Tetrapyrgos nigripes TaxID=182062 RepID=A0A8H5GZI0_9AGAR|nr:hypothetical protein D9758_000736 [Tetrapyrgos nigripes]
MHPSVRVLSARVHTPLIRFLGKRSWPSTQERPHSHPYAPSELKDRNFADFSKEPTTSTSKPSSPSRRVYNEFWEAPKHIWSPKVHVLEDAEIDAILSGGASLR